MSCECEVCTSDIHAGDSGTQLILTVYDCIDGVQEVLDISGASPRQIILKGPSGITSVDADLFSDGTDGKLSYIVPADFWIKGNWQIQAILTFDTGKFHSNILSFKVLPNLED